MNFLESLKQLKTIQPDVSYAKKSRLVILASEQRESMGARQIFMRIFETAGSLALVGIILFAVSGGFSSSRFFSPVSFQGIDPGALRAEAQAIDMQINIANLNYTENATNGGSTPMATVPLPSRPISKIPAVSTAVIAPSATTTATSSVSSPATTTASTSLSINQALQQLEQ